MDATNHQIREDLLNRAYDRVMGQHMEKFSKKKKVEDSEQDDYKKTMALEREKASQRKSEYSTEKHIEKARATGLSVEVIALMDKQEDSNCDSSTSERHEKKKMKKKKNKRKHKSDDNSEDDSSTNKKKRNKRSKKSKRNH